MKFAEGVNFKKIFLIFMVGSIFGTYWEMLLHYIKFQEVVSRSALVYGPFNPVYGLGAAMFALLVNLKNPIKVFISGMALGGFTEYMCSLIQEKFFGTIAWDYSYQPLNFDGRTSIWIMLFWGVLALLFVKIIYPFISDCIEIIPYKYGNVITVCLIIFMIFNCIVSVSACLRQRERNSGVEANNSISLFLDKHYPDERLNKIYVNSYKRETN